MEVSALERREKAHRTPPKETQPTYWDDTFSSG
jgi:hypothetical protein